MDIIVSKKGDVFMIISREELEKFPIIGNGGQGNIYQISSDTVVKMVEGVVNLELLQKMKNLELKQFLLPVEEVCDQDGIYSMAYKYIDTTEYKNVLYLIKKYLLTNIEVLQEDITILSENRILIRDLIPRNSLCLQNKIYILDFDLYKFADNNLEQEMLLKLNMEKLQQYFNKLWIMALVGIGYDRRILKYHPEYFEKDYIETIQQYFNNSDSILEYVKRK